jgi:hypothetical protein
MDIRRQSAHMRKTKNGSFSEMVNWHIYTDIVIGHTSPLQEEVIEASKLDWSPHGEHPKFIKDEQGKRFE